MVAKTHDKKRGLINIFSPNQPRHLELQYAMKLYCDKHDVHMAQFVRAAIEEKLQRVGYLADDDD
jgi:hypothetical protein